MVNGLIHINLIQIKWSYLMSDFESVACKIMGVMIFLLLIVIWIQQFKTRDCCGHSEWSERFQRNIWIKDEED